MAAPDLGKIGIWAAELRGIDNAAVDEAAAELDELGFGALWMPGGRDGNTLIDVSQRLAATRRIVVATGIINLWKHEPRDVADWYAGLSDDHKGRVMIGIGISHSRSIGEAWDKPLTRMRQFIDALDVAGMAMDHTCLAALGPKMVALSGERTAGAHPYLVSPDHTREAREILGPDCLLMPEQGVILETDPARARAIGLEALVHYRGLPNYRNSWKRLGFSEEEVEEMAPRLFDALFTWGGMDKIAQRVRAHHDAGANHVCLQVAAGPIGQPLSVLMPKWRELAEALL